MLSCSQPQLPHLNHCPRLVAASCPVVATFKVLGNQPTGPHHPSASSTSLLPKLLSLSNTDPYQLWPWSFALQQAATTLPGLAPHQPYPFHRARFCLWASPGVLPPLLLIHFTSRRKTSLMLHRGLAPYDRLSRYSVPFLKIFSNIYHCYTLMCIYVI